MGPPARRRMKSGFHARTSRRLSCLPDNRPAPGLRVSRHEPFRISQGFTNGRRDQRRPEGCGTRATFGSGFAGADPRVRPCGRHSRRYCRSDIYVRHTMRPGLFRRPDATRISNGDGPHGMRPLQSSFEGRTGTTHGAVENPAAGRAPTVGQTYMSDISCGPVFSPSRHGPHGMSDLRVKTRLAREGIPIIESFAAIPAALPFLL